MINPCPRRVLCPPGTGTDRPGTNYSSEHIDVPEYYSPYYPDHPYNYYSACQGRCVSLVSQEDANLCAARNAAICIAQSKGKPTYGNTAQTCTGPNNGNLVVVPPDVFLAGSVAEANAQALSYANKLQQPGVLPPGPPHIVPPPGSGGGGPPTPPNVIPVPAPVPRPRPPPPPASQCKPCDDTSAVTAFSKVFDISDYDPGQTYFSPPLKCGRWKFSIDTNAPLPPGSQGNVVATLVANDPGHTFLDYSSLPDCPLPMAWTAPCGSPPACDPLNTGQYALTSSFCCGDNEVDCKYAECQTIAGQHYLVAVYVQFAFTFPEFGLAHQFTFKGQWLGPLPTPP